MSVLAKPEPRKRAKARAQRHERAVAAVVRAVCVGRDGYCRFGDWEDHPDDAHSAVLGYVMGEDCEGDSQWAHMGEHRRFRTRGQAPEVRHTTADSLMLCATHHHAYDEHTLTITATSDKGADGALVFGVAR